MKKVPDAVRQYLSRSPEQFTVGFVVSELLKTQNTINATLQAQNRAGKVLKQRFGVLPVELMPASRGLKFVPVSEKERTLFERFAGMREAASCMGMNFSMETWHTPGDGGDSFSGSKGRISPGAKLDREEVLMLAALGGFTGVALHTWLDFHPDELRALSLNLLARGLRINSAFHGAFHGPIFARGAMSSEFWEVRFLAHELKLEGQLVSLLGWDAATAIEESLRPHLGDEAIEKLRGRAQADPADDSVALALKLIQTKNAPAIPAICAALADAGIEGNVEAAVEAALGTPVQARVREVCDWDGSDGQQLHEAIGKPATLLELTDDELASVGGKTVSRLDLIIIEKALRIVQTGGLIAIKIEPKYFDPSEMVECNATVVIQIKERVEALIRQWVTAAVRSEQEGNPDWESVVEARMQQYLGCVVGQIEEGHGVQMPARTGSSEIDLLLHHGAMSGAYHENYAPTGTGYGDPDFSALVTFDSVRRQYFFVRAGLCGPQSDPAARLTTEFDMAPHFWDVVLGFLASMNAVNTSIGIALNLIKVEAAMQEVGELSEWEAEVQDVCGTLLPDQGIFASLDSAQIHAAVSVAFAMATQVKLVPAARATAEFRAFLGKPYRDAMPSRLVEAGVVEEAAVGV